MGIEELREKVEKGARKLGEITGDDLMTEASRLHDEIMILIHRSRLPTSVVMGVLETVKHMRFLECDVDITRLLGEGELVEEKKKEAK